MEESNAFIGTRGCGEIEQPGRNRLPGMEPDRFHWSGRLRSAFGLVEVALSALLIGLGVLPTVQSLVVSSQETRANVNRAWAGALAGSVIERNRRSSCRDLEQQFPGRSQAQLVATEARSFLDGDDRGPVTVPDFLETDPLVLGSPAGVSGSGGDPWSEFSRQTRSKFRIFASYEPRSPHSGWLRCSVAWREVMGGRRRGMIHTASRLISEGSIHTRGSP